MSWRCQTGRLKRSHLIHAGNHRKVFGSIFLGGHQEPISLCSRDVYHVGFSRLGVDAIHLDNLHLMPFDPKVLASKGTDVRHPEEVGLSRLHRQCHVLRIVHESGVWDGLGTCGVLITHKEVDQARQLIMVPVR